MVVVSREVAAEEMKRIHEKTEISNKSFTVRLMASYSLLLFVILCIGVFFCCFSVTRMKREVREQNRAAFVHSAEQMEADLSFLTTFAQQISNNSKLVRLANLPDNDSRDFYLLAYEVREWLSSLLPSHSMVPMDSYFIHLRNTDYILSFNKVDDLRHHYANRLLKKEDYQRWKAAIEDERKQRTLIPIQSFAGTYTRDPDNFYYVISMDGFSFHRTPADICFELDAEKLRDIFSGLNLYDDGYILGANPEGQMMFTIQGKGSEAGPEHDGSFFQGLSYDENGFSSYEAESTGETMLVTRCNLERGKWNYYLVQPSDQILHPVAAYQHMVIAGLAAAILLGFLMIAVLSRRNSRPLAAMKGELNRSQKEQRELLELTKQQEPFVRNSYIRQVIQGDIGSEREMEYVREYLGFSRPGEWKYYVLYCNIYGKSPAGAGDNGFCERQIEAGFKQYFPELKAVCSFQEHSFALLLAAPLEETGGDIKRRIAQEFMDLHDDLLENKSWWIFGGLGSCAAQIEFVWKSYQQAREAIHYTTQEQVICSYSSVASNAQGYYYPRELAAQLTGFIEAGNQRQIRELFKVIQKENLEKRILSSRQMNWLLSDIRNTLLKSRFSLREEDSIREGLETLDEKLDELPSLKLWEDLALELAKMWESNTSENDLINQVKHYIEENYSDPSLCLTKISDEFSISECYFSYLFKKTTGENFSSYLEHLRMKKAMELLKNTNIKISQIFVQLGYNNITSFRRAFKKNYGVSPNRVRESARI